MKAPSGMPKNLTIYYGSHSGTAEKLSQTLQEDGVSFGVFDQIQVKSFEDFNEKTFGKSTDELVLCAIATHYEGEPCDNTAQFHKFVKQILKSKDKTAFKKLKFAIFGLGESTYEKFNEMAKFFEKAFVDAGGTKLFETGLGDSVNNKTEETFDEWRAKMWPQVFAHFGAAKIEKPKVDKKKETVLPLKLVYPDKPTQIDPKTLSLAARQHMTTQRVEISSIKQMR